MKYVKLMLIVLILYGGGLSSTANAGAISKHIKEMCPEQAALYATTIDDFSIRMQNPVNDYGCGVVSAYGVFANEKDMDRIEQWEENDQQFETVSQIFSMADQYQLDISANPVLFDALQAVYGSGSAKAIDDLDQLISQTSSHERLRINRHPERVLYLMWASRIGVGKSVRQTLKTYQHLLQEISLKDLPVSLIFDGQIALAYPDYSPKKRIQLIKATFHTYSSNFMAKMVSDPLALSNIIDLLPPQSGDILGSQVLTNDELERMQQDYEHVIQEVIASFEATNISFGASVDATGMLAAYIIDALRDADEMNITSYLKAQIHSPVFQLYINNQKNCDKNNFAQRIAIFFSFLAPNNKTHKPISYLQHNLTRIANWYNADANMRAWVIDEGSDPIQFIHNMSLLPYYNAQASPKAQRYASRLLNNLSDSPDTNAAFLIALFQQTDYFRWLEYAIDADDRVLANEDTGDLSSAKYRYILTTPFPNQDDQSVFKRFIQNRSGISAISLLHGYSVNELRSHLFTNKDKLSAAANILWDVAEGIVDIAAVVLSDGGYIPILMASKGGSMTSRQLAKMGAKFIYSKKNSPQNSLNTGGKRASTHGLPSLYPKTQPGMVNKKTVKKWINRLDNIQLTVDASAIAKVIYCAKFVDQNSNPMLQGICRVQPEPSHTNICQTFKN